MKEIQFGSFNKIMAIVGLFHGLLIAQGKRWETSIGPGFRFLLLCLLSSQVFLISELFSQLPENTWDIVFKYLYEPVVLYCFVLMLMFGSLSLAYTVAAAKVMKSLVG